MQDDFNKSRRNLLGVSALGLVAAQLGTMGTARAQSSDSARSSVSGTATAKKNTFGPLKHVNAGVLSIAYAEVGPADGPPVLLFHGWPYDIHSFVDVAPILADAGYRVLQWNEIVVYHEFSQLNRREQRTHRRHARNEACCVVMRYPWHWVLPAAMAKLSPEEQQTLIAASALIRRLGDS